VLSPIPEHLQSNRVMGLESESESRPQGARVRVLKISTRVHCRTRVLHHWLIVTIICFLYILLWSLFLVNYFSWCTLPYQGVGSRICQRAGVHCEHWAKLQTVQCSYLDKDLETVRARIKLMLNAFCLSSHKWGVPNFKYLNETIQTEICTFVINIIQQNNSCSL